MHMTEERISSLDLIEGFLTVWMLMFGVTACLIWFVFKIKKQMWENIFTDLMIKIQENFDIPPLSRRTVRRLWMDPPINFRLYSINPENTPERINETLYNIVRELMLNERVEQIQGDLSFVGPNGDTKEYLTRDDLDGIFLRSVSD